MTNKEVVLARFPKAKLVRDGWQHGIGPSGCFDFAVYDGDFFVAQATTPQGAWKAAREVLFWK